MDKARILDSMIKQYVTVIFNSGIAKGILYAKGAQYIILGHLIFGIDNVSCIIIEDTIRIYVSLMPEQAFV